MTTRITRTWKLFGLAAAGVLITAGAARSADPIPQQTLAINEELSKSWKLAELKASKKASDYEFVRRAFIDKLQKYRIR